MLSYWRRRSSNASPVPPTSQPTPKVPPQLPLIPDSTALTATFDEKLTAGEEAPNDYFSNFDGEKTTLSVSTIDAPAPSSSSGTPAVAPPSSDDYIRPRSSPDERDTEPSLIAQPNHSQPSLPPTTPGLIHGDASKPSSPFAVSSGKDRLTPKGPDGQSKRSTSPGMAPSGHRRFRTSPDVSPGDKLPAPQKEYRFEGPTSRRQTDRDVQPVEPVSQRGSGKTMLHLLNPLSLLAKRRSHQVAGLRAEDVNKGSRNIIPIPDDYDPRIRGKIVHDFSAPRPRRQLSAAPVHRQEQVGQPGASTAAQLEHANDEKSPYSPLSEQLKKYNDHSPVFREHFEDDKRALQVENKAYLQSSLLTDPLNRDRDPHAIPVFARKLPSSITDPDKVPEEQANSSHEIESTDDAATTAVEDADTVEIELPHQASGLPKHFKSNASRFSFDMNGVGSSTQEKLLEEKHKEKEAARKAEARLNGEFSDVDDDYENDMFDDMDGLEEEIPGVNVDADDGDDFKDFSGPGNIWNKSWLAPNLSPVVASPVQPDVSTLQGQQPTAPQQEKSYHSSTEPLSLSPDTMLPDNATDPSKTFQRESKDLSSIPLQTIPDEDDLYFDDGEFGELDTEGAGGHFDESVFDDPASHLYERRHPTATVQLQPEMPGKADSFPLQTIPDEDDLYFDDGEFGELDTKDAGERFDESIFDDPTSHLYERKQPTAPVQPQAEISDIDAGSSGGLKHVSSTASDYHQGFAPRRYGSIAGNMPNPVLANSHSGILSEHNLEAFHNALADAANQSAAKGRLGHTTSVSERSIAQESAHTADSQPGLVSDESRISQAMDMVSFDEVLDDFDYDDNDDMLYDDPIIAAANAEALENDDEGFYGHEFGFYAQAYGAANSELTNGGYFGPRGAEGISRSHSGRGKFREPSLTPITERSEWSTRNSIISVNAHGVAHSNQSVSSPGLAQLVDLNSIDDEMSLSALMKLRRDAWGGSNGSLRSSSGSPPPQQYPASNRGSLALSDVSPTVHTVPPDFLGGPSDSPIRESDKSTWAYLPQQRTERTIAGDGDS
ncbi:uncharacterized protein DSM5745_11583 [Aspergillus mulundensis]|uniref:Uncharacterized protein n=1 Tax=Aspergillus mulundensis TaxID=1810919 RepID=A0A3D8Q5C6_9EURO|nr:Uncharacterized protein DSM5745_11583 [Aspergillus mulundensis]RDW57045.1 Uncharacterized protein DSM5745_11583 [Aspergillus mulundensis]